VQKYNLAIVGAGPAGCTAAVYAGRSGIETIIFDKGAGGGLLSIAPKVENFPGFTEIAGAELATRMVKQAKRYAAFHPNEEVKDVKKEGDKFMLSTTNGNYETKALILCTGSLHRKLNVEGEKEFLGKGVSYCATCDGFFFRDRKVAVVGGGSSALIEAIYLKQIGCKEVYVVHRRDVLRGEKILQDEARKIGIRFLLNKVVEKLEGEEVLEKITLRDIATGKRMHLEIDGIFVSIGVEPENSLAKNLGVKLDERGYILTDEKQRTSMKGVYAAGDVTGKLRQLVEACAEGAKAGLSCAEFLGKGYPYL